MITRSQKFDLTRFTTFGVPVAAAEFITFSDPAEAATLDASGVFRDKYYLLGGGANTLFVNKEYNGKVIRFIGDKLQWIEPKRVAEVEAGWVWDKLVEALLDAGVCGVENLSGIPGHLGGCVSGNIGAYGSEIAEYVRTVKVYDTKQHAFREFSAREADFAYRNSIFKRDVEGRYIILSVFFEFPDADKYRPNLRYKALDELFADKIATPQAIRQAVLKMRNQKLPDPAVTGNAGSFFKNPIVEASVAKGVTRLLGEGPAFPQPDGKVKLSAGWLMDRCGWKGFATPSGAGIDPRNALVLVNNGEASGQDILSLADSIIEDVKLKVGIELQPEVQIIK